MCIQLFDPGSRCNSRRQFRFPFCSEARGSSSITKTLGTGNVLLLHRVLLQPMRPRIPLPPHSPHLTQFKARGEHLEHAVDETESVGDLHRRREIHHGWILDVFLEGLNQLEVLEILLD